MSAEPPRASAGGDGTVDARCLDPATGERLSEAVDGCAPDRPSGHRA